MECNDETGDLSGSQEEDEFCGAIKKDFTTDSDSTITAETIDLVESEDEEEFCGAVKKDLATDSDSNVTASGTIPSEEDEIHPNGDIVEKIGDDVIDLVSVSCEEEQSGNRNKECIGFVNCIDLTDDEPPKRRKGFRKRSKSAGSKRSKSTTSSRTNNSKSGCKRRRMIPACGIEGCMRGFDDSGEMWILYRKDFMSESPYTPVTLPKHLICMACLPRGKKEHPDFEDNVFQSGEMAPLLTIEEFPHLKKYIYKVGSSVDYALCLNSGSLYGKAGRDYNPIVDSTLLRSSRQKRNVPKCGIEGCGRGFNEAEMWILFRKNAQKPYTPTWTSKHLICMVCRPIGKTLPSFDEKVLQSGCMLPLLTKEEFPQLEKYFSCFGTLSVPYGGLFGLGLFCFLAYSLCPLPSSHRPFLHSRLNSLPSYLPPVLRLLDLCM